MKITLVVVATLIGLASAASAMGKFARKPDIMAAMAHVGVTAKQVPLLGLLELLGAMGLLIGIWNKPLGVAASIGLTLYFLGATSIHVRLKDKMPILGPPLVLFLIALATAVLELQR
ncbi:MAG TPA: DoxX family protein [Acidimicrobiales bacterium]|nr:DoxX family protein [Acidimicrobiales bacterium]